MCAILYSIGQSCDRMCHRVAEWAEVRMYTNNEILFPHHVIPSLRKLRGPQWRTLVERIINLPETHEETLAFMMMMIRLDGCMACETDSYRAMRGCAACALQTLRRYKGEDDELITQFSAALEEVQKFAGGFEDCDRSDWEVSCQSDKIESPNGS